MVVLKSKCLILDPRDISYFCPCNLTSVITVVFFYWVSWIYWNLYVIILGVSGYQIKIMTQPMIILHIFLCNLTLFIFVLFFYWIYWDHWNLNVSLLSVTYPGEIIFFFFCVIGRFISFFSSIELFLNFRCERLSTKMYDS